MVKNISGNMRTSRSRRMKTAVEYLEKGNGNTLTIFFHGGDPITTNQLEYRDLESARDSHSQEGYFTNGRQICIRDIRGVVY
tara:strand:+ start:211 stop:456 length:246 start_codon:yes stop_codon:yes gene_type:complete